MKHTEEIMRLADAYAEQMRRSGAGQLVDAARAALEAALSAKQGEQEAVPLTEYQKLQALVTSQGIRLMEYESAPEAKQEPIDSNEKAGAYMDARLWEFVDMAASWPKAKPDSRIWDHVLVYAPETKQEPVAQGEPCGWFDPQTGDYSRVNRIGWSEMYLHPAPVNTALLERAAQLACDAVAFNGGSVQMEAHVRAAIAGLRSLKEQEPVAWMCSNSELMHKGYQRFSATPGGDWNIPVYTHPAPSVNAQEGGGCTLAGPGRGDCEHSVGIPGKSIPGQHDGPDDTVDAHGKPNGWCWSCWKSQRISELEAQNAQLLEALRGMVENFCWGDMNDGEHAAIEVARAAIAAAEKEMK